MGKKRVVLVALLVVLIIGLIGAGIGIYFAIQSKNKEGTVSVNSSENQKKDTSNQNKEETKKVVETKEQFISSCSTYTYKEIARNPNNYIGKRAKLTGEVIQVQEEDGIVAIRLNITKDQYGYYSDTIMVGYVYKDANESKILEDDIITVYGELKGNTTYTSIFGAEITLPLIHATYIDIE